MKAAERKFQSILHNEITWMQREGRVCSAKQKSHIQSHGELRDHNGPEYDRNVELGSDKVETGQTVKLGYFSQENEALNGSLRAIDYIKNGGAVFISFQIDKMLVTGLF